MKSKLKYWSAFIPIVGIVIIIWYAFFSKHIKEYCLYDETNTLLVGVIQFCVMMVILCELGFLQ